jgi:voltage-gated potassium channel
MNEEHIHLLPTDTNEQDTIEFKNRYDQIQYKIWNTFEQEHVTTLGKIVNLVILCLILVTVFGFMIITDRELLLHHHWLSWTLFVIEYLSVFVFTIEYLLKVYSCTNTQSYYSQYGSLFGRLRFIVSPISIIDLISIVPAFVTLGFYLGNIKGGYHASGGFVGFSMKLTPLRLLRVIRVVKVEKYVHSWKFVMSVIIQQRMMFAAAFFLLFAVTIFLSVLMYLVESELYVHPKTGKKGNPAFASIPYCFYWILTTTAIGIFEVSPGTWVGQVITCLCAIISITAYQIPGSILASGFVDEIEKRKDQLHGRKKENKGTRLENDKGNQEEPDSSSCDKKHKCEYTCPNCSTKISIVIQFKSSDA